MRYRDAAAFAIRVRAARERQLGRRLYAPELRWLLARVLPGRVTDHPVLPGEHARACAAQVAATVLERDACLYVRRHEGATVADVARHCRCGEAEALEIARSLVQQGRLGWAG